MAVYIVTGELGSGKTLLCIKRIQDAFYRGARVATNIDLRLEHIVSPKKRRDYIRLADWPTIQDFHALGRGYEGKYDEKKFGLIVLDEAATYLNSRTWGEKVDGEKVGERRMKVTNWLRHARKFGWDVILISQDLESLDKQIRIGLAEHVVKCRRLDRLTVPLVSWITKLVGLGAVTMPQVHLGIVRYGASANAPLVDRWVLLRGQEFHDAYDTGQRILGETDGPATMFDARHAPYLWEPKGWREALYKLGGWRWFGPSIARQRYNDSQLFQRDQAPTYKQPVPSYSEWSRFRRRHGDAGSGLRDAMLLDTKPVALVPNVAQYFPERRLLLAA